MERTARGRIAATAAEHGWREMFDDVADNARIYERSGCLIIVGYRPAGAVTGANRMYPSIQPRKELYFEQTDQLTHLDSGKAEQVLGWLAEDS